VKRLVGRTDLEDSLKRLDKLTHEEARMATAQVLKVTHTVNDRMGVVDGRVRVVEGKVASVDDRVRAVNDNVIRVIEGEQITFSPWLRKRLT
jgi:ABC-type thiamine transport system ATPase subunit